MSEKETILNTEMYYFTSPRQYYRGDLHTDTIKSLGNGDFEPSVQEALKWAEDNDIEILYDGIMDSEDYQNTILANSSMSLEDLDFQENDTVRVILFSQQFEKKWQSK